MISYQKTQKGNFLFCPVATKEVKQPLSALVCLEFQAQNLGTGGVLYDTSNYNTDRSNSLDEIILGGCGHVTSAWLKLFVM